MNIVEGILNSPNVYCECAHCINKHCKNKNIWKHVSHMRMIMCKKNQRYISCIYFCYYTWLLACNLSNKFWGSSNMYNLKFPVLKRNSSHDFCHLRLTMFFSYLLGINSNFFCVYNLQLNRYNKPRKSVRIHFTEWVIQRSSRFVHATI